MLAPVVVVPLAWGVAALVALGAAADAPAGVKGGQI